MFPRLIAVSQWPWLKYVARGKIKIKLDPAELQPS
jgi:hypothetical protein